jgi:hypothetical protein
VLVDVISIATAVCTFLRLTKIKTILSEAYFKGPKEYAQTSVASSLTSSKNFVQRINILQLKRATGIVYLVEYRA